MATKKIEDNVDSTVSANASGTSDRPGLLNVRDHGGNTSTPGSNRRTNTTMTSRQAMLEAKGRPSLDATGPIDLVSDPEKGEVRSTSSPLPSIDEKLTHRQRRMIQNSLDEASMDDEEMDPHGMLTHRQQRMNFTDEEEMSLQYGDRFLSITTSTQPGAVPVVGPEGSSTQPTVTTESDGNEQHSTGNIESGPALIEESPILTATLVEDTDANANPEVIAEAKVFRPWKYVGAVGCLLAVALAIGLGVALPNLLGDPDPLPTQAPSESPTLSPLGIVNEFLSPANLTVDENTTEIVASNAEFEPIPSELGLMTSLTSLSIFSSTLDGSVPSELGLLSSLQYVQISETQVSGPIPEEFGSLSHLKRLRLHSNQFSGSLPPLGQLTLLLDVLLYQNNMTGSLPSELGMLTALTRLRAHDNRFEGRIPTEIGKLRQLQRLWLSGNQITGAIPTQLGLMHALEEVFLSGNSISEAITSELGNLSQMTSLNLQNNQLTSTIPSELGLLSQLQALCVSSNELTGSLPTELALLPNLGVLHLSNNKMSGMLPTEFGLSLMELDLRENNLSGPLPTELGLLTNLKSLILASNVFSGPLPTELALLSNLEVLHLNNNKFSGMIPTEFGLMTNIKSLQLDNNTQLVSNPNASCTVDISINGCWEITTNQSNNCQDVPMAITFKFNGGDCSQSDILKDRHVFDCIDYNPPPTQAGAVSYIVAQDVGGEVYYKGFVAVGDFFTLNENMMNDRLSDDINITIYDSKGSSDLNVIVNGGNILQTILVDLSCSQPLFLLDRFGASQVAEWIEPDGRVVTVFGEIVIKQPTEIAVTVFSTHTSPIRLLQAQVVSNVYNEPVNKTGEVYGAILVGDGDVLQLNPVHVDVDPTKRTRYTFFGIIIAQTIDGSAECNGFSFHECTAGIDLPPIWPTLAPTYSPTVTPFPTPDPEITTCEISSIVECNVAEPVLGGGCELLASPTNLRCEEEEDNDISYLKFEYTGGGCNGAFCEDFNGGPSGSQQVYVEVSDCEGTDFFQGTMDIGDTMGISSRGNFLCDNFTVSVQEVDFDEEAEVNNGAELQFMTFSTTCQAVGPFWVLNDSYGCLLLQQITSSYEGIQATTAEIILNFAVVNHGQFDVVLQSGQIEATAPFTSNPVPGLPLEVGKRTPPQTLQTQEIIIDLLGNSGVEFVFSLALSAASDTQFMLPCDDSTNFTFTL